MGAGRRRNADQHRPTALAKGVHSNSFGGLRKGRLHTADGLVAPIPAHDLRGGRRRELGKTVFRGHLGEAL